jgi:hypothetical protein
VLVAVLLLRDARNLARDGVGRAWGAAGGQKMMTREVAGSRERGWTGAAGGRSARAARRGRRARESATPDAWSSAARDAGANATSIPATARVRRRARSSLDPSRNPKNTRDAGRADAPRECGRGRRTESEDPSSSSSRTGSRADRRGGGACESCSTWSHSNACERGGRRARGRQREVDASEDGCCRGGNIRTTRRRKRRAATRALRRGEERRGDGRDAHLRL